MNSLVRIGIGFLFLVSACVGAFAQSENKVEAKVTCLYAGQPYDLGAIVGDTQCQDGRWNLISRAKYGTDGQPKLCETSCTDGITGLTSACSKTCLFGCGTNICTAGGKCEVFCRPPPKDDECKEGPPCP